MSEKEVRAILAANGYKNVSDEMLRDFMSSLEKNDDSADDDYDEEPQPAPKKITKRNSPPKFTVKNTRRKQPEPEPEEYDESDPEPEPVPIKKTTRVSPKRVEDDDSDDEIQKWSQRMQSVRSKADEIERNMQECRSVIMDPPEDEPDVDVPMYFGTSERKLDPYPTVKRKNAGGFIRPPPVKPSKKPVGSNKKKGRRLLYEERFPDYVPPPERRRDALRWSIRQKLIYSHPDYQK